MSTPLGTAFFSGGVNSTAILLRALSLVAHGIAAALKEHFVLQKIAEVEKIDIKEEDIDEEIERLAAQNNESPRRVRARLEKEDLLDVLATEIIEREALNLILDSAEYEDVPLVAKDESAVTSVEAQAVPGEMKDPAAAAAFTVTFPSPTSAEMVLALAASDGSGSVAVTRLANFATSAAM